MLLGGQLTPPLRFVDRDMFMRYEWGLGIGHTYSHKDATAANQHVLHTHASTTRLEDAFATPEREDQSHPERLLVADRDNDAAVGSSAELEGGPDIGANGEGLPDVPEDEGEDEDEDEDEVMSDVEDYDDRRDNDDEVEKEYLLFGS